MRESHISIRHDRSAIFPQHIFFLGPCRTDSSLVWWCLRHVYCTCGQVTSQLARV